VFLFPHRKHHIAFAGEVAHDQLGFQSPQLPSYGIL